MIAEILLGVSVAGHGVMLWLNSRRYAMAFSEWAQASEEYRARAEADLQVERDRVALYGQEVSRLKCELSETTRLYQVHLTKNTDFERERDEWQRLYTEQAIGHGNAQNLMMQTINEMGARLSAHGIKYRMPKIIEATRSEYLEHHEMPARAVQEKLVADKAKQETPQGA